MTIRDPEVLEALRDKPELLALADAVAETQRPARAKQRYRLARPAALLAAGAAAVLVALFWPGGGGGNGILERALAAIGRGQVLHLVVRVPVEEELVNLETGKTTVPPGYVIESWSDRNLKRFHMIFRWKGRTVGEVLFPQDRSGGVTLGKVDPAYAALWSGYRQALADGKAKVEGSGRLYGRPVYWLRFPSAEPRAPGSLVAIDRRSYRPLAFRFSAGGRHVEYRILLARTEPFSAAAFTRRTPKRNPYSGPVSSGSGESILPSRPFKLRRPWLRAGSMLAGLKLSSVSPLQETSGGKTTRGVTLVYGSDTPPGSLTIQELQRPGDRSEWTGIPRGFARITAGESSSGRGTHATWTAQLVRAGIYVTIETDVGHKAVLEAARALRPA